MDQNKSLHALVRTSTGVVSATGAGALLVCFLLTGLNHFFPAATASQSDIILNSASENLEARICLLSDLNGPYGTIDLPSGVHAGVARLSDMQCDLVLGAGDLVAGQDTSLSSDRLRAMWNEWQRVVADPFLNRGVPVLSAMGNHDASAERRSSGGFVFQRERDAASQVWNSLLGHSAIARIGWISREQFPFYYSFAFKTIGVVVFDGSSAGEVTHNRAWLEQQLSALASNPNIKTRIVVGHLPLFAVAKGRETVGNIIYNSADIYALLNRYRVDFYISGHHHAFYPARPSADSKAYGTVQLALGAMGDGPRKLLSSSAPSARHSMTILDIVNNVAPALRFVFGRFNITTMSPFTGEVQPIRELPSSLNSFNGQGQPAELLRFDLD